MDSSSRAKIPNKPKQSEKEIKTFDMEDIDKCFEYALTEDMAYYVLLSLTFFGGVRLSEALGLTWESIDFTTGEITINQQLCYDRTGIRHKTNRVYIGPPKESVRQFTAAPQLLNILKEWKIEQEQNKKLYGRAYKNKEVLDNEITGRTTKGANFVLRRENGRIIPTYEAGHFRTRLQNKVFEDLFLEIPPKFSVSGFMGYLKGKSTTMLYEQFGELKYKYRNREFWCRGYYVDTVGKNEKRIAEYVKNQLKEDELGEQLAIPGSSPFTGRK